MNFGIGNYIVSLDFRMGVGLDLEFVDSRPVWTMNNNTGKVKAMCMEGVVILAPLILLSIGKVYDEVE